MLHDFFDLASASWTSENGSKSVAGVAATAPALTTACAADWLLILAFESFLLRPRLNVDEDTRGFAGVAAAVDGLDGLDGLDGVVALAGVALVVAGAVPARDGGLAAGGAAPAREGGLAGVEPWEDVRAGVTDPAREGGLADVTDPARDGGLAGVVVVVVAAAARDGGLTGVVAAPARDGGLDGVAALVGVPALDGGALVSFALDSGVAETLLDRPGLCIGLRSTELELARRKTGILLGEVGAEAGTAGLVAGLGVDIELSRDLRPSDGASLGRGSFELRRREVFSLEKLKDLSDLVDGGVLFMIVVGKASRAFSYVCAIVVKTVDGVKIRRRQAQGIGKIVVGKGYFVGRRECCGGRYYQGDASRTQRCVSGRAVIQTLVHCSSKTSGSRSFQLPHHPGLVSF